MADVSPSANAYKALETAEAEIPVGFKSRAGSHRTFWEEHYFRCPLRKAAIPSFKNAWGLLLKPAAIGIQIFLCDRVLTAYDVGADVVVTTKIDREVDPMWFRVSIFLMVLPILLKMVVFHNKCITKLTEGGCPVFMAWAIYLITSPVAFAVSDFYLLLAYPWVEPSASAFVQQFARLSALIEGFMETTTQNVFQIYMYTRVLQLGRHTNSPLKDFLLFSVIPGFVSLAYKLYVLAGDAKKAGLPLCEYTVEIFKAPLNFGRAPFYELLSKQQEVNYEGIGPLSTGHQEAIFLAVGGENDTILRLRFDDGNGIHLNRCGAHLAKNNTLQYVSFGSIVNIDDAISLFNDLKDHTMTIAIGRVEISYAERLQLMDQKWIQVVCEAKRRVEVGSRVRCSVEVGLRAIVESAATSRQTGFQIPPNTSWLQPENFGNAAKVGDPLPGKSKYHSCTTGPDGVIYGIPCDAERVLSFDPKSQTSTLVGDSLPGDYSKYLSCTTGPDGVIYGIPYNAERVLAFDPKSQTSTLVGDPLPGYDKYRSCTAGADGVIYGIPYDAERVLAFDPAAQI